MDDEALIERAYREAGHAVMAYLIVRVGVADHLFARPVPPGDRAGMLPDFEFVDLNEELARAARPTSSLGSLLAIPLFLMGGSAAQRIRNGIRAEGPLEDSRPLRIARGMLVSYGEEFGAHDPIESMQRMFQEFFELVDRELRSHWRAVQSIAEALLGQGRISTAEAFELAGGNLPDRGQLAG